MSKAVKGSIIVLVVLLGVSIIAAVMTLLQNEALKRQNSSLQSQIADYEAQEKQLIKRAQDLKSETNSLQQQLNATERSREDLETRYDQMKSRFDSAQQRVDELVQRNDQWEDRLSTIRRERDNLARELRERPEKVVEKVVYRDAPQEEKQKPVSSMAQSTMSLMAADPVKAVGTDDVSPYVKEAAKQAANDSYWAGIVRAKAALEVELDSMKQELDEASLTIVELKNKNNDLQLQIDRVTNEKEDIVRQIKQGEDLANNLSLQLARARNDQRQSEELAEKIKTQNARLQTQVKELTNTKLALEKTITKIAAEKNAVEQKLLETENVIQSRIDEIWQIKETLDRRISTMPVRVNNREIELPPIIVNAANQAQTQADVHTSKTTSPLTVSSSKSVTASIISVNEENNFVIVDKGARSGSQVGDRLTVYRGGSQIGTLEVIQVREDISAADIRTKTAQFKVGDAVR